MQKEVTQVLLVEQKHQLTNTAETTYSVDDHALLDRYN